MPKELIYSDDPAYMRDGGDGEVPASEQPPGTGRTVYQRGVHVGWSRQGYVEVGVAEFAIATQDNEGGGHYTTLDRAGLNRLIRTLRKARDAAFGADA